MKHASLSDLLTVLLLSSFLLHCLPLKEQLPGAELAHQHCPVKRNTEPTLDIKRQA